MLPTYFNTIRYLYLHQTFLRMETYFDLSVSKHFLPDTTFDPEYCLPVLFNTMSDKVYFYDLRLNKCQHTGCEHEGM